MVSPGEETHDLRADLAFDVLAVMVDAVSHAADPYIRGDVDRVLMLMAMALTGSLGPTMADESNVEKTAKWSSTAVEEKMTSAGPVGVGSTRRAVVRSFGHNTENEAKITAFEPNRKITPHGVSEAFPFRVSMVFASVTGGTRVD